jgi:hypothetical protein
VATLRYMGAVRASYRRRRRDLARHNSFAEGAKVLVPLGRRQPTMIGSRRCAPVESQLTASRIAQSVGARGIAWHNANPTTAAVRTDAPRSQGSWPC